MLCAVVGDVIMWVHLSKSLKSAEDCYCHVGYIVNPNAVINLAVQCICERRWSKAHMDSVNEVHDLGVRRLWIYSLETLEGWWPKAGGGRLSDNKQHTLCQQRRPMESSSPRSLYSCCTTRKSLFRYIDSTHLATSIIIYMLPHTYIWIRKHIGWNHNMVKRLKLVFKIIYINNLSEFENKIFVLINFDVTSFSYTSSKYYDPLHKSFQLKFIKN